MPLVGSFRVIEPPSRLEFTWSWSRVWPEAPESLVVLEFEEAEGGTKVAITHGDFDSEEMVAPHAMGWDGGAEKLVRHFEKAAV
ncbi:MAG: SRPBCC family protein [Solirubrobacteraceae bacterium]